METYRVFINEKEASNFANYEDALHFAAQVFKGKEKDFPFNKNEDVLEVETDDAGLISVEESDFDESGKIVFK